jgi:uncharacterized protein (TIGR00296 family)
MVHIEQDDKIQLARIAKSTLQWCLEEDTTPTLLDLQLNAPKSIRAACGSEVVFKKWGDLRTKALTVFTQEPLYKNVITNVISAAKKSALFPPILHNEVQYLTLELSIVTPPYPIQNHRDINLEQHGIIFEDKHHEAMFLPGTPGLYNWDLHTTLDNLCKKAGLAPHHWRTHGRFLVFEKTPIYFEKNPL